MTQLLPRLIGLFVLAAGCTFARAQQPPVESKDPLAEKRIAYLREQMGRYQIRLPGAKDQPLALSEKLALRWSNPVSGVGKGVTLKWQVAATRLTQYAIRARLDGELIADLPRNEKPKIDEPFYRGWHWFSRYPFAAGEGAP